MTTNSMAWSVVNVVTTATSPLTISVVNAAGQVTFSVRGVSEKTEPLLTATESFRRGWKELTAGQGIPLSEFWEGVDVE